MPERETETEMARDGTETAAFQWALGTSSTEDESPISYPRTVMLWPRRDKDKTFLWG